MNYTAIISYRAKTQFDHKPVLVCLKLTLSNAIAIDVAEEATRLYFEQNYSTRTIHTLSVHPKAKEPRR